MADNLAPLRGERGALHYAIHVAALIFLVVALVAISRRDLAGFVPLVLLGLGLSVAAEFPLRWLTPHGDSSQGHWTVVVLFGGPVITSCFLLAVIAMVVSAPGDLGDAGAVTAAVAWIPCAWWGAWAVGRLQRRQISGVAFVEASSALRGVGVVLAAYSALAVVARIGEAFGSSEFQVPPSELTSILGLGALALYAGPVYTQYRKGMEIVTGHA